MNNNLSIKTKKIPQNDRLLKERFDTIDTLYAKAKHNRENFWNEQANNLKWQKEWNKTFVWDRPYAKWFSDGKLNASENCLDIHLTEKKNKNAIIWESEAGDVIKITYKELAEKVNKLANGLKHKLKIKKGDRITIYMPLIPEAVIAMLACSRIGAIHSVVFGGFSAPSLAERIKDSNSKLIITADIANRRGKTIPLLEIVSEAMKTTKNIPIISVNNGKSSHNITATNFNDLLNDESDNLFTPPEIVIFVPVRNV